MRCALRYLAPVAALAPVLALGACGAEPREQAAAPASPSARPTLPAAEAPLSRAGLLLAVVHAGSAAAAGADDAAAQRELAGKRFALRLRFGCAERGEGTRAIRHDAANRRVALSFAPELDLESPQLAGLVPGEVEAAEGFWIRQPWLLEAACPRGATDAAPEALPRVGIAHFFTERDRRTHRRERRAYETSETLLEGEVPSRSGYDLVIEGRLQALPDGRVIACTPRGGEAPTCVISADFTQVSLERADTRTLLAEWPSG